MATISSSNYYSVSTSGSTTNGLSGLVSGVDTDTMVKDMLAGTQAKIDAQYGMETQTTWKQEMYREVIDSINEFSDKYFDTSYGSSLSTNLASSSFFDSMTSTVTGSSAVSIVSTSSSANLTESYAVAVTQLASSSVLSTGAVLSGDNTILGTALTEDQLAAFDNKATLTLDVDIEGVTQSVEIDLTGATSSSEVAQKITSAFNDKGIEGVEVTGSGTGLSITSDTGTTVTVDRDNSDKLGIQYSGLSTSNTVTEDVLDETDEETVVGTSLSGEAGDFTSGVTTFTLTFDGTSKLITLNNVVGTGEDGAITEDDVLSALQTEVNNSFGGYVQVNANVDEQGNKTGGFNFSLGDSIASEQGHEIKITGSSVTSFGFTAGASSMFDTTQTLEQLGITDYNFSINGVDFSFNADSTVSSVMTAINNSDASVKITYSTISDTMKIENIQTGSNYGVDITESTNGILSKLFGLTDNADQDGNTDFSTSVTAGQDALITVNGVETSRSSNTFTIEGITMTLNSVSASSVVESTETTQGVIGTDENGLPIYGDVTTTVSETVYETSNITNSRDDDAIVEAMKSFIEDYNALILELNDLVGADKTYSDYAPLSDTQMEDMTETQIELWQEKAQKGLLSGDIYIESFLSSMRTALYQTGGNSGIAIYQIGITTSSDYEDNGKLVFDEAAFRSALSSDADAIKELFTNSTDGLAATLTTIIKNTANKSSGSPGTLVSIAGVEGYSSASNNTLSRELVSISSKIESLLTKYESEKERYWEQFTNMEVAMNNYSTQSSLFTQTY